MKPFLVTGLVLCTLACACKRQATDAIPETHVAEPAAATTSAAQPSAETAINTGAKLPPDAAKIVEQIDVCSHLSGEVGSGDPGGEKEVSDSMHKNSCNGENQASSLAAIQRKYARDAAVTDAINKKLMEVDEIYGTSYATSGVAYPSEVTPNPVTQE